MSDNRRYFKQAIPVPFRAHPLWKGCIFAHAVGWGKGFDNTGAGAGNEPLSTYEDIFRTIPVIDSSGESGNFGTGDMGRGLQNGGVSLDEIMYGDQNDRFLPQNGAMSIACLVRPLVIPASGTASGVLDKATAPGSTVNTEYTMGINGTASTWRFYVAPTAGAVEQVNSVSTLSLQRTDLLVGTYSANAMKMIVNGILEASIVPSNTGIRDNAKDLGWFQMSGGTGAVKTNALVGMGAVWDRELTELEAMDLYRDPYVMWQGLNDMVGLGMAQAAANARDMLLSY